MSAHPKRLESLACVVALLVGGLGCGQAEAERSSRVRAIYDAPESTILTPYPSNRYTREDATTPTGIRVSLGENRDQLQTLPATQAELESMDGFSTHGGVIVALSGPAQVDAFAEVTDYDDEERKGDAQVPPSFFRDLSQSPIALLNVDADSPQLGQLVGLRVRYFQQLASEYVAESEYVLVAQPSVPLLPATRYALVVTDRMLGDDGLPVARSGLMAALIEGTGNEAGSYEEQVQQALVRFAEAGLETDRVRLVTVFTTASVVAGVAAMSKVVRS